MAKPKNKQNVFVVMREYDKAVVLGVFGDLDEANDHKGAWEQEFYEKTGRRVYFWVQLSTYYG